MTEKKNPLEGILKKIIGEVSEKGGLTEEDVKAAWDSAVGEKAAAHSRPRSFKGGRLIVSVDHSSWLYELTVGKKQILKKMEEALKSKKIKEITLRIGELK
jgi:predicted nucleic acid-binding Zn ribbon protein